MRYSTTGFRVIDNVMSPDECDRLIEALAAAGHCQARPGARHLMSVAEVAKLAGDDRLTDIAAEELRSIAIPFRATLFSKSANANWLVAPHQDTVLPLSKRFYSPGWGPWSEKGGITYANAPSRALCHVVALRIHLDASTSENGPLRVVPGSQAGDVFDSVEVKKVAKTHGLVECHVGRGGVLAMSPLLIHASSKGRGKEARRVLHIEYADNLKLGPGIELALA